MEAAEPGREGGEREQAESLAWEAGRLVRGAVARGRAGLHRLQLGPGGRGAELAWGQAALDALLRCVGRWGDQSVRWGHRSGPREPRAGPACPAPLAGPLRPPARLHGRSGACRVGVRDTRLWRGLDRRDAANRRPSSVRVWTGWVSSPTWEEATDGSRTSARSEACGSSRGPCPTHAASTSTSARISAPEWHYGSRRPTGSQWASCYTTLSNGGLGSANPSFNGFDITVSVGRWSERGSRRGSS